MSERHMREARALMEAAHEAVSAGRPRPWRACEARAAAALEAAERRGVRAGLARAAEECELVDAEEDLGSKGGAAVRCAGSIRGLDPASVDVEP